MVDREVDNKYCQSGDKHTSSSPIVEEPPSFGGITKDHDFNK